MKKKIKIEIFFKKLKSNRELDEITKRTNFSINKDQIFFFDKIKNRNTDACSTGEQKSSLLTIILANCWKLKIEKKDFILLLYLIVFHDCINNSIVLEAIASGDTSIEEVGDAIV